MNFTREFLQMMENAQEATKKQAKMKRFLEAEEEKEAERYEQKIREEKRAEEKALTFFESWKPSSEPIKGLKPASPLDPVIKTIENGIEVRKVVR